MKAELYQAMVTLREQVKLLHFQTKSFATHKATDWFIEEFDKSSDNFWESYQAATSRLERIAPIKLTDQWGTNDLEFIEPSLVKVESLLKNAKRAAAARDDILDLIDHFRYLMTFH